MSRMTSPPLQWEALIEPPVRVPRRDRPPGRYNASGGSGIGRATHLPSLGNLCGYAS